MKILAFETSAKSASVAVVEDGAVLASSYQATGLTHSRTLMPMAEDLLRNSEQTLAEMDLIAIAAGPGSFTGLRIGIAAAKGLAWAAEKPCCGVSTLESMAMNLAHMEGALIICAMDARRNQVYNAFFLAEGGRLRRLCEDRAVGLEVVASDIKEQFLNKKFVRIIVGDGAELCYNYLSENGIEAVLAPAQLRRQSAVGVALAAEQQVRLRGTVTADELVPVYLRLSQAERERLAKGQSLNS